MNEEIDDLIYRHCLWLINTKGFYKDDAGKEREIMAKRFAEYIQRLVVEARIEAKKEVLEYMLDFTKAGAIMDWDFIDGYYSTDPELSTNGGSEK